MVFRVHFTAEDLARTRVATAPRPLLEVNMAVRQLGERSQPTWRRQVLARLPRPARMVFDLMPPRGYTPMFLVPNHSGGLPEQLDLVRGAARAEVRDDMTRFAERHRVPGWAGDLDGDAGTIEVLAKMLDQVYAAAVAPSWSKVTDRFAADRAIRARQVLDGGVDRLLCGLHPTRIRWVRPVLEIATVSGAQGDLHLRGRGLLLVPTYFGPDAPTIDPTGAQPYLTYPVARSLPSTGHTDGSGPPAHLVALLGRTRAAVLHAIVANPGCTTGELAALSGTSPPSASEHATVLRAAGLITTARYRQAVLHTATPVGECLLGPVSAR